MIQKINQSTQNYKNNLNFKGNLSYPLPGKLAEFVESRSNVKLGISMLADSIEFEANSSLQVLLRELPEESENAVNNMRIMYIDSKTSALGEKEFFLDAAKSAQDIFSALNKALRDAIPKSFII